MLELASRQGKQAQKAEESLNAKSKKIYTKDIEVYLAYNGNELDKIEIESILKKISLPYRQRSLGY